MSDTEVQVEKTKKPAIERLKTDVKTLSDKILADLTFDASTKKGAESEANGVYYANLPDGLTREAVDAHDDYTTKFVAATRLAGGQLAYDAMKSDKDLEEVTTRVGIGSDNYVTVGVTRSKTHGWTDISSGERKETVKYGATQVGVVTAAGSNGGQIKLAGSAIAELFAAGLG